MVAYLLWNHPKEPDLASSLPRSDAWLHRGLASAPPFASLANMKPTLLPLGALILFSSASLGETIDFYIGCTPRGSEAGIYLSSLDESTGKISAPKKIVEFQPETFKKNNG